MEMIFKQILVEREDEKENKVFSSSGTLVDNKFVIVTANVFDQEVCFKINQSMVQNGKHIYLYPSPNELGVLNIVLDKNGDTYNVKKGTVFAVYSSNSIQHSEIIFKNFAVDSMDNNRNLGKSLSTFFILTMESKWTLNDFKQSLQMWWEVIRRLNIEKCAKISIESSPFGNRHFMNSISNGILSNIMGKNDCLIISDCPSTPGSEGSPVFIGDDIHNFDFPIGIVLSCVNFWKGEWTGLTIIANMKSLLIEFLDPPVSLYDMDNDIHNHLVAQSKLSLVQIYSGLGWGTAIFLDSSRALFITNSHVIVDNKPRLFYNTNCYEGEVLYQTPANSCYDVALIKCKDIVVNERIKPILISKKEYSIGETIYAAGFPLFGKESNATPTFTKGCIAKTHKFKLTTTCSVHAGSSGGAILDRNGFLLGIIVCNTKLNDKNAIFPKINMAIPYSAIADVVKRFMRTNDLEILKELAVVNKEITLAWNLNNKL